MRTPAGAPRRGTTLIEVLVAMAIMSLMMVGVLEMFSLSLMVNKGSAARTVMLFRCQQVVENVRYYYYLQRQSLPTPDAGATGACTAPSTCAANCGVNTGIPWPIPTACTINLPYDNTDAARWAWWGPTGANVMEVEKGPYKVSYAFSKNNPDNGMTVITVTAIPTDDPTASQRFFGMGLFSGRRIDYVAQF